MTKLIEEEQLSCSKHSEVAIKIFLVFLNRGQSKQHFLNDCPN